MDYIQLPEDLVAKSPGFSFDIGASVAKIIYRSKECYRNGKPTEVDRSVQKGMGTMMTTNLPCNDIDGIIALLRNDCDIMTGSDVIVTGVGANRHKEKFEKELNVRLKIVPEFDMAVDGALFLLATSQDPFLPLSEESRNLGIEKFLHLQSWLNTSGDQGRAKWLIKQDVDEALSWKPDKTKIFPYLGVTCGSIFSFVKVYEDGKYEYLDTCELGGRCVLGLLAQLTKQKNFDELLAMATSSDGRSVDLFGSDMRNQDSEEDNIYTSLDNDMLCLPFGKAYDNEEVKPGDMVYSILNIVCTNVSQKAHLLANLHNCPRVIFSGSFASSSAVQNWIARQMTLRNLGNPVEQRVNFGFLRHGGMLAALGVLTAMTKI